MKKLRKFDIGGDLPGVVVKPGKKRITTSRIAMLNAPTTINPQLLPTINRANLISLPNNFTSTQSLTSKIGNTLQNVVPYASNIMNLFRKPVAPPIPAMDRGITLQRLNFDNDRAMIERGVRGMGLNADRTLDENTAQAVKQYALAQRYNQLSQTNQMERNANNEIANREAEINANINARNNAKMDQRGRDLVEMQVANQREKSANIANAADKYITIQNEKAKSNLDLKKFAILGATYNQDGVAGRRYKSLSDIIKDPANLNYYNEDQSDEQNAIMEAMNDKYLERKKKALGLKKYGGPLKYKTGGMMKIFKSN